MARSRRRRILINRPPPPAEDEADASFEKLCEALDEGKLVPVIGDTIRIEHIFDVDLDKDLGLSTRATEAAQEALELGTGDGVGPGDIADTEQDGQDVSADDDHAEDGHAERQALSSLDLNVMEELADYWAQEIGYPLLDSYRMSRVAQYQVFKMEGQATEAKKSYLAFLKRMLLSVAENVASIEEDSDFAATVAALKQVRRASFADIVNELDFPRFPEDKEDPLRVLARLPIKIFLTTSYYDFIEQALVAENKKPRSRLCLWNMDAEAVEQEHRSNPDYEPDVKNPVVYHLFGMERYPQSMVLSEDDYLRFLWRLAQPPADDGDELIIPSYLEAELKSSSLLLLGYRLQDWDLRVLFHGLLNVDRVAAARERTSVAIQIDPDDQPLVKNRKGAEYYLDSYFREAKFHMRIQPVDEFIAELGESWRGNGGV